MSDTNELIKRRILQIMNIENRSMNIKEITEILDELFDIKRSQQTIKKYLKELVSENKLKLQ